MEQLRPELHEANRRSWNLATVAHNSHKADQASYFREGGSTLFPEDLAVLGDVRGRRLAHLQCNAGQDSLSLAALGADVTAVDISDEAIAFARQLSADTGIPAEFVRADVYDWLDEAGAAGARFDIVFCSHGALIWLSDLERWVTGIARILVPGGFLAVVEFHPIGSMFNERMEMDWPYFSQPEPIGDGGIGDYVGYAGEALTPSGWVEGVQGFQNSEPSYEFTRGIGEIITPILRAGLRLAVFEEYPYTNGAKRFDASVEREPRRFYVPEGYPDLPLMYALKAVKA